MELKFDNYSDDFGSELLCPNCNSSYLHHTCVEVFERSEDAAYGVHATVANGKAAMDTSLNGNPSARRHGVAIRFRCEACQATPLLTISQHKGNTIMNIV